MDFLKFTMASFAAIATMIAQTPEEAGTTPQAEVVQFADWPAPKLSTFKAPDPVLEPAPNAIPMESVSTGCDCDGLTEADVRKIALEVYQKQQGIENAKSKQVSSPQSSGGSSGGSLGTPLVPRSGGSYGSSVASPMAPVIAAQYGTSPAVKRIAFFRDYRQSDGCTVRETTWSDGTVTTQVTSCPLRRARR